MVANWALGERCEKQKLLELLAWAPFTLIVLVETTAVAGANETRDALMNLSERIHNESPLMKKVLEEKTASSTKETFQHRKFDLLYETTCSGLEINDLESKQII